MARGTYTIVQMVNEFQAMSERLPGLADVALRKVALDVRAAAEVNTPVGESGELKRNWDMQPIPAGGNLLARYVVYNSLPYMPTIEFGSKVGSLPWKSAGPRTVEQDGRIWSSQAVGGVLAPIMENDEYISTQVEAIAAFILGGL